MGHTKIKQKRVCVVGLGYIGLPTALIAASHGYDVVGFDCNHDRVKDLNNNLCPLQEPGLTDLLRSALEKKTFSAVAKCVSADYFIIAVPTPIVECGGDKKADLRAVYAALDSVISVLQPGNTIILESTVPVGTTDALAKKVEQATGLVLGKDFFCAYSPERVLPGKIVHELQSNSRVIGGCDEFSCKRARDFYQAFVQATLDIVQAKTAELVKLLENSYRDVQLAFAAQVAHIADVNNLDPYRVIALTNKHPRVNVLQPTAGVGGHCIALDPWFLIDGFPEQTTLLRMARMINDQRPHDVMRGVRTLIKKWRQENTGPCTVACLGATYKPNVDDMRESPALTVIEQLSQDESLVVCAVDPHCSSHVAKSNIPYISMDNALACADIIVCLVAHDYFGPWRHFLQSHAWVYDACGFLSSHLLVKNCLCTMKKRKNNETSCS